MVGDGALAGHQALGHRAAVEQDHLVLVVTVVVVPVQYGGGPLGGQAHGPHGDGGAHIDLAGGDDAPVVQLRQQHAGTDAQMGLHLVPAPQGQGVQVVLLDVLVDDHRQLAQVQHIGRGHVGKIRVVFQPLDLGGHDSIVIGLGGHLVKDFAQIEGLHVDAVLLHGDLVKAHRLKSGSAGADAAQVEPPHTVHHPAYGSKIP